ncbi:hypothetical protein [Sporosarcina obsidiansis]|uniref:hypothetical protein n=1 Tax=Sporosarcina obsidiansis TaxID=2660748 RepID=UPI00129A0EAE|nr:hypothetical protein [Sporosarcina obsidiansis]
MKVVELVDYKKKIRPRVNKQDVVSNKSKSHADLLKEAFNALDKLNKARYS